MPTDHRSGRIEAELGAGSAFLTKKRKLLATTNRLADSTLDGGEDCT